MFYSHCESIYIYIYISSSKIEISALFYPFVRFIYKFYWTYALLHVAYFYRFSSILVFEMMEVN